MMEISSSHLPDYKKNSSASDSASNVGGEAFSSVMKKMSTQKALQPVTNANSMPNITFKKMKEKTTVDKSRTLEDAISDVASLVRRIEKNRRLHSGK